MQLILFQDYSITRV